MKVRHITKRKLCSWGMRRAISTYVLKDTMRHRGDYTLGQKARLRYRDFWK